MRSNVLSVSLALFAVLILAYTAPSQTAAPSNQESVVEFKRVSFRYDPTVFGKVRSESIPARLLQEEGDQPEGVAPEYTHFAFDFGREDNDAHISVYPLNDYARAYSVNSKLVKFVQQKIKGLKEVIRDPSYRLEGEIPHLPFRDATDNFYVKVKQFNFQNGKGVIFVTHWTHGVALVSNRNLVYRYEGFSDDGKYYITAETPIQVRFLPFDPPDRFEGFTYEHLFEAYRRAEMKREYEDYLKSITNRLSKLESADFFPDLEKFESMIASLKIATR